MIWHFSVLQGINYDCIYHVEFNVTWIYLTAFYSQRPCNRSIALLKAEALKNRYNNVPLFKVANYLDLMFSRIILKDIHILLDLGSTTFIHHN